MANTLGAREHIWVNNMAFATNLLPNVHRFSSFPIEIFMKLALLSSSCSGEPKVFTKTFLMSEYDADL